MLCTRSTPRSIFRCVKTGQDLPDVAASTAQAECSKKEQKFDRSGGQ